MWMAEHYQLCSFLHSYGHWFESRHDVLLIIPSLMSGCQRNVSNVSSVCQSACAVWTQNSNFNFQWRLSMAWCLHYAQEASSFMAGHIYDCIYTAKNILCPPVSVQDTWTIDMYLAGKAPSYRGYDVELGEFPIYSLDHLWSLYAAGASTVFALRLTSFTWCFFFFSQHLHIVNICYIKMHYFHLWDVLICCLWAKQLYVHDTNICDGMNRLGISVELG